MKELFARHKKTLIISSILILLPVIFGVAMWDRLPDPMPTHFNAEGTADGYSSKAFAVFGLPLFILACQWLCMLGSGADPKRRNINPKVLGLILWVCPAISLLGEAGMYAYALGYELNMSRLMLPLVALVFIVIGNYLPKCRQSYTMGIKLPWTLADEDNWNKTHRMAGPLWMGCGLVMLVCAFLPGTVSIWLLFPPIMIAGFVPTIYSFLLAKKKGQI